MNAIVLLTHVLNDQVMERFEALGCPAGHEKFILLDATGKPLANLSYVKEFRYAHLAQWGYRPMATTLIPGSNHFPVLEVAAAGNYETIWCVEYDVMFLGTWGDFFQAHQSPADFLTTWVERPLQHPDWPWWRSFNGPAILPGNQLLRSFNPVYRLSARAVAYLRKHLRNGWVGHHEVTMASLLMAGSLEVEDLGGGGEFVREVNRGRWYDRQTYTHTSISPEKMAGRTRELVHPVKWTQQKDSEASSGIGGHS
jgi:hypothetical protein